MLEVREYIDISGRSPFALWFDDLDDHAAVKVTIALERIATGHTGPMKRWKTGSPSTRLISGLDTEFTSGKRAGGSSSFLRAERRSASSGTFRMQRPLGRTTGRAGAKRFDMALTRDFRETIRDRAQRDQDFRQGLLLEGLELIYNGDFPTGRAVLRNYIHATIGFSELARETHIPSPSLQRMFGPAGNPRAGNLLGVLAHLQRHEGVSITLQMQPS